MGNPHGVLDESYSADRQKKSAIRSRYRIRAQVAAQSAKEYLGAKGLRILDLGCAEGLTLLELDKLLPGSDFTGIEYSSDLLKKAPPLPSNINLMQGDITRLPAEIPDDSYDFVSALAVIEHVSDPAAALKQAAAKLRGGGVITFTCPNPLWEHLASCSGLLNGEQHESHLSLADMAALAKESGLTVLAQKPFMWAPTTFLPYLGVTIDPRMALKIDSLIHSLRIADWAFTNQVVTARK